ncbi:uncharacterized protein LOC111885613 [Lactuca sativa]|nr:uncharacterized protein LOC111885613 [Lactuca sativa]
MTRVVMTKARGHILAAIDWLNKYREIFMAGHDAWRELAEIYVSLQLYKQAGFCYEELILSLPIIPIHHLAYVDVEKTSERFWSLLVGHEYMSGGTESYCYGHIPDCGGSAKRGYSIRHDYRISAQKLHDATYRGIVGVSFDVVQYG